MKALIFAALSVVALTAAAEDEIAQYEGYELVWHDEFDVDGKPNPDNWSYERGFQRNHEDQWYQEDNAFCEDGKLIIEGRKERFKNPDYGKYSDWRNREYVDYTSSCITTDKKHSWTYGRFIIRAKIPAYTGCWPAIWLLGQNYDGIYGWPHNGEIDIMEFYQVSGQPHILANACWGGKWSKWDATWDSEKIPYLHFLEKDADWARSITNGGWTGTWTTSRFIWTTNCLTQFPSPIPRILKPTFLGSRNTIRSTIRSTCCSTLPLEATTEARSTARLSPAATKSTMFGSTKRRKRRA